MEIGKVPNDVLERLVLNKIKNTRDEVIVRPKIGEDCCAIDFGKYACVMSSDPITGAVNEVGRLAVHISCNDIASCGVLPIGLMVTILAPPTAKEEDIGIIMEQLCNTASSINVDIIGGHTEITGAVTRFVIVSTAVGRILRDKLVTTSGAKPDDDVIMTKSAGIEGTAIIANDKEEELLEYFEQSIVDSAKKFIDNISVVKEGIIAGEYGASAMHDITEGGVLGALWELSQASDAGIKICKEKIPIKEETLKIAQFYGINPLKLISSGSMLITCKNGEGLVKKLHENGIESCIIGKMTEKLERTIINEGKIEEIGPPEPDELYKVLG